MNSCVCLCVRPYPSGKTPPLISLVSHTHTPFPTPLKVCGRVIFPAIAEWYCLKCKDKEVIATEYSKVSLCDRTVFFVWF